jgi:RimJ/RimL family protein N-acetyltransferase
MQVPRLTTEHLILRPVTRDDAHAVFEIAGDIRVSKWLSPVPHPYALADAENFLERVIDGKEGATWAIEETRRVVGMIAVQEQLGYYLAPSRWGRGLMTEAVSAVLASHFKSPNVEVVKSGYFLGNHGSRRVLEKAGFENTDIVPRFSESLGRTVQMQSMQLTRKAWSALKRSCE